MFYEVHVGDLIVVKKRQQKSDYQLNKEQRIIASLQ